MGALGSIDKKTGWVLMEIPILLVVLYFFSQSQTGLSVSSFLSVSGIMVGFFMMHYFNRAVIYPQRLKWLAKPCLFTQCLHRWCSILLMAI